MRRALAAVRSAIFVVFLVITVMPWALVGLVYVALWARRRFYPSASR